jgi:hypothetical protein
VTPLLKFIRDAGEKLFGKFYEGPSTPERFKLLAIEFANAHPAASRKQWVEFAQRLAETTYRAGYVRGWESTTRDVDAPWRKLPPELVADAQDPDWRWRPALGDELVNPEDLVAEEIPAAPIDPRKHARNEPP